MGETATSEPRCFKGILGATDVGADASGFQRSLPPPVTIREKFEWDTERLEFAVAQMLSCAQLITPDQQLDVVPGDKNDNIIIECAVAAGAEAIVTGDKDLLRMKAYSGIQMVTVADLLQQQQFPK